MRVVKTFFRRDLFIFLWSLLLVIPGLVKYYEYYFVPYLTEDYPDQEPEDILAMSKQMTDGRKWELFVFDLSYLGWHLLGMQKKTKEVDGYEALQLGYEDVKESRANKAALGHAKKANTAPKKFIREVKADELMSAEVGSEIKADIFSAGDIVDVTGTSKGKGYNGTIVRNNGTIGPKAHGSGHHRHIGSLATNGRNNGIINKGTIMDVKATAKTVRYTPRKVRLVLDTIRGKNVDEALAILQFTPNQAAGAVAKVVKSAAANAKNNHQLDETKLYVKTCYADEGIVMKAGTPPDPLVASSAAFMVKKAVKPTQQNPDGGITEHEAPIDASNVMAYDSKAKKASRVGYKIDDKGNKTRIYKKSGSEIKGGKK